MKLETPSLTDIYAPIERHLPRVEKRILEVLETSNELSAEVIRYFFKVKGKLLRPALCLFGASNGAGEMPDSAIEAAAAFEIFHSATLIHDDMIDSAVLRRNMPTVHTMWSPHIAVLIGDYLHDRAIRVMFELHHDSISSLFLDTAGEVCDGEMLEIGEKRNMALTEARYFEIVRKKTALLLSCCLETGTVLANAAAEETQALRQFGIHFGMAFQMVDDCLDFKGKEHEFGKTLGADCAAGILTLPIIRLLEVTNAETKREVIRVIETGFSNDSEIPETSAGNNGTNGKLNGIVRLLEEHRALEYTMQRAKEFTDLARSDIANLRSEPVKKSLNLLLDYVLERNR